MRLKRHRSKRFGFYQRNPGRARAAIICDFSTIYLSANAAGLTYVRFSGNNKINSEFILLSHNMTNLLKTLCYNVSRA